MNKDSLKYAPTRPGKIQQFYRITPFLFDLVFLLGYLVFFRFFNKIIDKIFCNKLNEIVDQKKRVKVFADGRSSLLYVLKSLNLNTGDEIIINPNTCDVVCRVITSAGLVPKFMSTNEFGIGDLNSLKNSVSKKTKVIILTNTYGILEDYDKYVELAKSMNLVVINDLAQANLFDSFTKNMIKKSSISVLSFGPEKYLGALCGGVLVSDDERKLEYTKIKMTNGEVLSVIASRFKYWLTFLCFRFKFLKFFLKYPHFTYSFQEYKNIKHGVMPLIEIRELHQVAKLSIIFRFWLLKHNQKKEKNNFTLIKKMLGDMSICSPDVDSTPLFTVLNLKKIDRNIFAETIAKYGFQTLWNYVPLYEYKNYSQYAFTDKTNYWKSFIQVPFRFLSTKKILRLIQVIRDVPNTINFFDRDDWINVVEKVFGLKKETFTFLFNNEKKDFSFLVGKNDLYLNFIGYFNPGVGNIDEKDVIKLIDSINIKTNCHLIRMKLFPGIVLKKPSKFIEQKTQILDISQDIGLAKDIRYEINKALKEKVYTRLLTRSDIANFYKIYLETMDRVESNYVTPISLFYEILNLKGCFILGAFKDKILLGGSVYLCSNDYAFYWWNATSREGRDLCVNSLITNEAIKLLNQRSVRYLDFASSNNQRIFKSKQKWGAKEVLYYEYVSK